MLLSRPYPLSLSVSIIMWMMIDPARGNVSAWVAHGRRFQQRAFTADTDTTTDVHGGSLRSTITVVSGIAEGPAQRLDFTHAVPEPIRQSGVGQSPMRTTKSDIITIAYRDKNHDR